MAKSILQIVIQTLKEGNADKETVSSLKDLQSSIGTVTAVAGAMAAVYGVVDKVLGESIRQTVAYADEVRSMSLLTGQSTEESSRLLQVMDDMKVETGALTMATKTLAKEGLTMNIDTLAKLSDEYNSLGNSADKTAFLVKNFGKSGLDMAEAMSKGSESLLKMNDQVDKNLVLTQKQVDASRLYETNLDNMNDALLAMWVTYGNKLIPVINTFIQTQSDYATAMEEARTQTGGNEIAARKLAGSIYEKIVADRENKIVTDAAAAAMKGAAGDAETLAEAEKAAADAAKLMTSNNQTLLKTIDSVGSEEKRYAEQNKTLTEERMTLEAERTLAITEGYSLTSEKITEMDAALAVNSQKTQANADEHELASRKIVLGLIQQKLTADGILDDAEMNWLLEKGLAWGIYSQTVVTEAQKAIAEADALSKSINDIPDQKDMTIDIWQNWHPPTAPPPAKPEDAGGMGFAGESYVINPVAGPEVFIPSESGVFTPNINRVMESYFQHALQRSQGGSGQSVDASFQNYGMVNINAHATTNLVDLMRQARRFQQ